MQRFADHFMLGVPADAVETVGAVRQLPAECEVGRPTLERGSFHGLPMWYHAVEAAASFRTDDGRLFDLDDAIACFQFEHYVGGDGGPSTSDEKTLRSFYYRLKPFLPRAAQLALQRANARRRLREVEFPRWPADDTLNALFHAGLAAHMRAAGVEALPFLGFWPNGMTWAWSLTHDVDTLDGQRHSAALALVEEERGLQSCWYFVPERYPVDRGLMSALRERGHEIGVHGLRHTGNLFDSRAEFDAELPRINAWVHEWGAVGFRSPATYRNPYWLPDIDVDYDSSYMDNATLEPQRGGVCGTFPFMLSERMVELPITLPMDHTLLNVLQQDVATAFRAKLDWIRPQNGLAMSLVHPDYNTSAERRRTYAAVIDEMRAVPGGWFALPREIAAWWQRRRHSMVVIEEGRPVIVGPAAGEGRVWWARLEGDRVRIDTETQTELALTTAGR
jgi:peptidoglycan/xylan/chitin deacetylase (PgdA/CDA1 family)